MIPKRSDGHATIAIMCRELEHRWHLCNCEALLGHQEPEGTGYGVQLHSIHALRGLRKNSRQAPGQNLFVRATQTLGPTQAQHTGPRPSSTSSLPVHANTLLWRVSIDWTAS